MRTLLDLVYVIWLDEARARAALALAHATYAAAAVGAGMKPHDIDDWEDPADVFDGSVEPDTPMRARDPAERAEQIMAFLAASGQDAPD